MQKTIETLLKSCIKGDEKAQMQLYDKYCEAMFIVACRYLKNEEDAKDAMQDGFLKAFQNMKTYTKVYSFGAWLKRIIINQCLDTLKKQKMEWGETRSEDLEIIDDGDWKVNSVITKDMVEEALVQLSDKYQLVLKLYLIEGYDHEEISQILKIPVKTSRTQLRRGRMQLKELLKEQYYATGH